MISTWSSLSASSRETEERRLVTGYSAEVTGRSLGHRHRKISNDGVAPLVAENRLRYLHLPESGLRQCALDVGALVLIPPVGAYDEWLRGRAFGGCFQRAAEAASGCQDLVNASEGD